ncbi:unnamed protein product [Strongylus vulgaris]|uniref:Reverse transcriptase RNase H-like domain-containing protein n=1 Tax=Strongylus vulgaris TaxID=40348 RepID=A0A3P7L972_STRVU|nr:unnamed protein product [Strongylus vulgaris]
MISTDPVLSLPGVDKARDGVIISTDASTKAERRYHIADLEALVVVCAVKSHILYGLPVDVMTVYQPLTRFSSAVMY